MCTCVHTCVHTCVLYQYRHVYRHVHRHLGLHCYLAHAQKHTCARARRHINARARVHPQVRPRAHMHTIIYYVTRTHRMRCCCCCCCCCCLRCGAASLFTMSLKSPSADSSLLSFFIDPRYLCVHACACACVRVACMCVRAWHTSRSCAPSAFAVVPAT